MKEIIIKRREMSPRFLARMVFVPAALEGQAHVWGQLRIPAGLGYSTYLWRPLANSLYPYNLFLGVGELLVGLWLLVFGVNPERWKEQARATREFEAQSWA